MKRILLLALLLMTVSAQSAELTFQHLTYTVVTADSNATATVLDTAYFDMERHAGSFYWRTLRYQFDSLFTGHVLSTIVEHSPGREGFWTLWDSTKITLAADSVTGNGGSDYGGTIPYPGDYYIHVANRILSDSAYGGNHWRVRLRLAFTVPTTTTFTAIKGNVYRAKANYWFEPKMGNETTDPSP